MSNSFVSFRLTKLRGVILRTALAAATLSMAAPMICGKARHKKASEETLHIRLYDRTQIPAATLYCAMAETSRIFRAARIKLEWERPLFESPEDGAIDLSSQDAPRTGPARQFLVVRILRIVTLNIFPGALGFALPFARSGPHVEIFYDRIAATGREWNVAASVVLGYALAHEIGHVLLRSSAHSFVGLMQPRWNEVTWHLVSQGLLGFRSEEKAQMRERLLRLGAP